MAQNRKQIRYLMPQCAEHTQLDNLQLEWKDVKSSDTESATAGSPCMSYPEQSLTNKTQDALPRAPCNANKSTTHINVRAGCRST